MFQSNCSAWKNFLKTSTSAILNPKSPTDSMLKYFRHTHLLRKIAMPGTSKPKLSEGTGCRQNNSTSYNLRLLGSLVMVTYVNNSCIPEC